MIIILSILSTLLIALGMYFVSFGTPVLSSTASQKDTIWGYSVPMQKKIKSWRIKCIVGWCIFGLGCVVCFWNFMKCCWAWVFPWHIWAPQLLFTFLPIFPAWKAGKKWIEKTLTESDDALFLGNLPILQAVDAQVPHASQILIANEHITTFDQTGFPRFTAKYAHYQLGDLQKDSQKILLSYYFRQKYKGQFICEPNTTTHYVQSGGTTQLAGTTVKDIRFIRK